MVFAVLARSFLVPVACGRGKKWKPAVELLDTMRREGLTPDGVREMSMFVVQVF